MFEPQLIILSSEVRIEKPDPRIFQLAVQKTRLPARECLFCTEDLLDTLVAQKVGMCVARVQEPPANDVKGLVARLVTAGFLPA